MVARTERRMVAKRDKLKVDWPAAETESRRDGNSEMKVETSGNIMDFQ